VAKPVEHQRISGELGCTWLRLPGLEGQAGLSSYELMYGLGAMGYKVGSRV